MVLRPSLANDAKTTLRKAETVFLLDHQNKDEKVNRDVFTESYGNGLMMQERIEGKEIPMKAIHGIKTRASNLRCAVRYTKRRHGVIIASSVFGIDGSSAPAVKSWGYQSSFSLRKLSSSGLKDRLESQEEALKRDKKELVIRCVDSAAAKPHKTRTSPSSPCFSARSTSWMGKTLNTYHRKAFKQSMGLTRSLSLPDVTIKKINLNERPKGKIATNQERKCFTKFSEVLQNQKDLTYASDYIQRQANCMLNRCAWKTKLDFQDGEECVYDVFQEKDFEEKKLTNYSSCCRSTEAINEPDFCAASLPVRKIDIKLPWLGQVSERR